MKVINNSNDNLKAVPLDDCLKAVGYTSSGERKEYKNNNGQIYCPNSDLVSLEIPEGVKYVFCSNNLLTELDIPKSVKRLYCDRNVKGLDNIDSECDIRLF